MQLCWIMQQNRVALCNSPRCILQRKRCVPQHSTQITLRCATLKKNLLEKEQIIKKRIGKPKFGWYDDGMADADKRKLKDLTPAERETFEQGWNEIGKSIGELVASRAKTTAWAWSLIAPLGIYERWMLYGWIDRSKKLLSKRRRPASGRPQLTNKCFERSKFSNSSELIQVLKLVKGGLSPQEAMEVFNQQKNLYTVKDDSRNNAPRTQSRRSSKPGTG